MSFTPEPGTPLATYYAETQPRVGTVLSRRDIGPLDAVTIGRYAMTIGATDPAEAAVGTVRKLYAESKERNAIHASDSDENATREGGFFFSETELIRAR